MLIFSIISLIFVLFLPKESFQTASDQKFTNSTKKHVLIDKYQTVFEETLSTFKTRLPLGAYLFLNMLLT